MNKIVDSVANIAACAVEALVITFPVWLLAVGGFAIVGIMAVCK